MPLARDRRGPLVDIARHEPLEVLRAAALGSDQIGADRLRALAERGRIHRRDGRLIEAADDRRRRMQSRCMCATTARVLRLKSGTNCSSPLSRQSRSAKAPGSAYQSPMKSSPSSMAAPSKSTAKLANSPSLRSARRAGQLAARCDDIDALRELE